LLTGEIPEGHIVNGVKIQLSQVILNILNNAFDASVESLAKWVKIEIIDKDEYFHIEISDSGAGISPEVEDKIFQPFFTTKELGKGTGIGLSLSKGIVEKHSGRLFVKKESKFNTLVIELPKHKNGKKNEENTLG
jgi:signal transduction histidine kinase